VAFCVFLGGFGCVMGCVVRVALRRLRVVGGLLVIPLIVMSSSLEVMLGCALVVLGCFAVMVGCLL